MPERFAAMLEGGHRNSLGRTEQVVEAVLADPSRLDELFACLAGSDDVVRMRAGDALEKVCRVRPAWFAPLAERVLELGEVEQASVQWHVAQMLDHLLGDLSPAHVQRATALLERNLIRSTDWIVLCVTMDVLTGWTRHDPTLARRLAPPLERLSRDPRKSVAKRASKCLARLA